MIGTWNLKTLILAPTSSIQLHIFIPITINNSLSFNSFQEKDYCHFVL